jgi:succinyl-CoA synthetase beta subunit
MVFDDNALPRHPELADLRDTIGEDPREIEAAAAGLSYIGLGGDIGCMVNGAGLAMATADIIRLTGGQPANFLDVGGGVNEDAVRRGFLLLLSDPNIKSVLVNIFGGIVRCDLVAAGIVKAVRESGLRLPLVIRLKGTNVEDGKRLLAGSGIDFEAAETMDEAAAKAVRAAGGERPA